MPGKVVEAGLLRHRLSIQQGTVARNGEGEPLQNWACIATIWGRIQPLSAREQWYAQQVRSLVTHKITIRFYSGLTPDMRFQYGTRTFHIESILTPEEVTNRMDVLCIEVVSQLGFVFNIN